MAESLSAEQIAERRTNLYAFRHSIGMDDDSELTTTLRMQEEWLATVDELEGYARDALTLRGLRTRRCLFVARQGVACTGYWADKEDFCAPCYMRAIHLTSEMLQGIREGVKDVKEGRVRPWSEVEAEIWDEEEEEFTDL